MALAAEASGGGDTTRWELWSLEGAEVEHGSFKRLFCGLEGAVEAGVSWQFPEVEGEESLRVFGVVWCWLSVCGGVETVIAVGVMRRFLGGLGEEPTGSAVGVMRRCFSGRGHMELGEACACDFPKVSVKAVVEPLLPFANRVSGR